MSTVYIIGDYSRFGSAGPFEEVISLSINSHDLVSSWKRCGLTADYTARYFSENHHDQADVYRNIISSVLNELLENSTKFSRKNGSQVKIILSRSENCVMINSDNEVSKETAVRFTDYLDELKKGDLSELYFSKIESGINSDSSTGIGLLMILKNYSSGLRVSFKPVSGSDYEEYMLVNISLPISLVQDKLL